MALLLLVIDLTMHVSLGGGAKRRLVGGESNGNIKHQANGGKGNHSKRFHIVE